MREFRSSGSVRGALSNERPYRDWANRNLPAFFGTSAENHRKVLQQFQIDTPHSRSRTRRNPGFQSQGCSVNRTAAIDDHVFEIRVFGEGVEKTLPHSLFRPSQEPIPHAGPAAEVLR